MDKNFYSGFVSIIGRPNVGKSTLMNSIIGEKISIVSNKPQTTRNKINTILNLDNFQIVFIDTPGIHTAKSKLGNYMMKSVENSIKETDIILYMISPKANVSEKDIDIIEKIKSINSKKFLIINKIDTIRKDELLPIIENFKNLMKFDEIIPISAINSSDVNNLINILKKNLNIGPKYFPEDMITDQQEKQIVSEIIREKCLIFLQDEVPHGIAVEVTSMKIQQKNSLYNIDAIIYCEKDSHKGMIIGKNGEMLKKIGTKSRIELAEFLKIKINLQLWVKVKSKWREDEFLLKNFGYDKKNI